MPAIGITGGVATGKTALCDCLRQILPAAKFFNADDAAHRLVELPEVREEIRVEFGNEAFSNSGDLNRTRLRAIVFADATKKRALERMKPAVKACAIESLWWPVRTTCSYCA